MKPRGQSRDAHQSEKLRRNPSKGMLRSPAQQKRVSEGAKRLKAPR
jgi:hypothetical protein